MELEQLQINKDIYQTRLKVLNGIVCDQSVYFVFFYIVGIITNWYFFPIIYPEYGRLLSIITSSILLFLLIETIIYMIITLTVILTETKENKK